MLGKMDCAGRTDPGRVRTVNEDQYLIASLRKSMEVHNTSLDLDDQTRLFGSSQGRLLLVADGQGGAEAGRRASALAVNSLTTYVLNTMHWFFRLREDSEEPFLDDLKAALDFCQDRLRVAGEHGPALGTTLTMAYLVWPRLFVVHAGDSRCYLRRGGRLRQLTRDHTTERRRGNGETHADDPDWSRVLWNVVGGESDELAPEVYSADLRLGDTVLLCTDGLTRQVGDDVIAGVLGADTPAEQTCRDLVDAANGAGGADNVTVVVAHFRDAKHQQAVQAEAGEATAAEAPPVAETRPADTLVGV